MIFICGMHGMRGTSEVQKTEGYFSLNNFLHSDAPRTRRSKTPTTFYPLKKARNSRDSNYSFEFCLLHAAHTYKLFRATSHSTISMRRQREKIQRNNYHHGNCGPSLTGKTLSVSLIFTHKTHRNVKKSLSKK